MKKTIIIPEEVRDKVQKINIERDARRDIIIYILQNNLEVSKERFLEYQKEYDEKYFLFEKIKNEIEKKYIIPVIPEPIFNWSLDYQTCIITVVLKDE